jgi:hypothetical protein
MISVASYLPYQINVRGVQVVVVDSECSDKFHQSIEYFSGSQTLYIHIRHGADRYLNTVVPFLHSSVQRLDIRIRSFGTNSLEVLPSLLHLVLIDCDSAATYLNQLADFPGICPLLSTLWYSHMSFSEDTDYREAMDILVRLVRQRGTKSTGAITDSIYPRALKLVEVGGVWNDAAVIGRLDPYVDVDVMVYV